MTVKGFGRQPRAITGRRTIDYADAVASKRASAAKIAAEAIWIPHLPQTAIIGRVLKLLDESDGRRGKPLTGLRLSQASQAGKSGSLQQCQAALAARRVQAGQHPNPFELLIVGLDKKIALKAVYQDILIQMGDDNWQTGSEKVLRQRIDEFCLRLGVRGICIDEVQHLRRDQGAVTDVTDAIKRLLDLGIAPLICVGDLDSVPFFQRNPALAARLDVPLELSPLGSRDHNDMTMFKSFCRKFDHALVACRATSVPAGLDTKSIGPSLHAASGGHVGRVARILQRAAEQAAWRGAVTIEPYDLSCVVRTYAMPMWVDHDPFSETTP